MISIIFDMDGVLFDSEPLHIEAWQEVIKPLGIELENKWFLDWVGIPDFELARYFHKKHTITLSLEELLKLKQENYQQITSQKLIPFDGLIKKLEQLKTANATLAVATSSSKGDAQHTLSCTGLLQYFTVIVSAHDTERHKPAPDPYLLAAQRINTSPEKCYVIEDSPSGIESAKAAGCTVYGVTSSHSSNMLQKAHKVFSSTTEAIDEICRQII